MFEFDHEPPKHEFDGLPLTGREQLIISVVDQYSELNYGLSPTQRLICTKMNAMVRPKPGRKQKYYQLQISRAEDNLRGMKIMIDPENDKELLRKAGNAILTPYGKQMARLVRKHLRDYLDGDSKGPKPQV